MSQEVYRAFITAFGAEHREMRRHIANLQHALHDDQPWSLASAREVHEALIALKKHLHHHFAQEEAGGYMEEALLLAPHLTSEAGRLLRQHPAMTTGMNRVLDKSADALTDAGVWNELRQMVSELVHDLVAHEAAENRLVQRAFNTGVEPTDDWTSNHEVKSP